MLQEEEKKKLFTKSKQTERHQLARHPKEGMNTESAAP